MLTVEQVAHKLRISPQRVRALIHAGRFPGTHRFGHAWAIPEEALTTYRSAPVGYPRGRSRKPQSAPGSSS